MKIRPFISILSIAGLGFFGVSCKSTSAGKNSGYDDGGYVGTDDSSEYDNVYEMGGGDDYDSYTYEDDKKTSSYNYESNDYSSNTYTPPAPAPAPRPQPTSTQSKPSYQPAPSQSRSHMVERGDTLFNISRRYGTSVAAIQSANGLNGDLIRIGETLTIP